ncbi:MAG: hypothetical protein H6Q69_1823 [Firmicutes bacterium]|nr:hypothetical protein [Bacillota bacterium]
MQEFIAFYRSIVKNRGDDIMAGALIWVNGDKSEQITYFNNEYVLITIIDTKKISLGETLEDAKEKLKEIGRYDIYKEIEKGL